MARDRRNVRYEDFAKPRRKRWVWAVGAVVLAGAGLGGAYATFNLNAEAHATPPAFDRAGGPVVGEAYQWSHVAVGGGGFMTGLSFDAGGQTFVARTDVYGAYVWDKDADRWLQLVTADSFPAGSRVQNGIADGAYEIAVAPSRPQRIYVAIKGQVFRSEDRGRHFTLAGNGNPFPLTWDANGEYRLGGPYMAVDPANPDLILLGAPDSGLWRSADGGGSWQRVASVPLSVDRAPAPGIQAPASLIWFEPGAKKRIFAMSSGHGMFASGDHGVSFKPLSPLAQQPMTLRRGAFDRHGTFWAVDDVTKSVWRYRDGVWTDVTQAAGLPAKSYAAIAANPAADQIVLFDQSGPGFQSVDEGQHWTSVAHSVTVGQGDPPWLKAADNAYFATSDIAFDPKVPGRLWVSAGMGVFYADLGAGASVAAWTSQTRGIEELVANDVIQPVGQSPIFGGWDFGLHVKERLDQFSTTFGPNERGLISVQQMDWSIAAPATIITNASDARLGCCDEDGNAVMAGYSEDGGRNWTKFKTLPTPPGTKDSDARRMSFGTIAMSAGGPDNIVWEPAFNRAPFYTKDRGRSWHQVMLPGAAGDNYGSFEQFFYQRKTLAADRVKPGVFYLVHSGDGANGGLAGLWRTTDGGANWSRMFSGEIAPSSTMAAKLRAVPGHAGELFFTSGFAYAGDTGLRRSTDGGATWAIVPDVAHVDDIAFGKAAPGAAYPAIYISGRVHEAYGVWRSLDNAKSWQKLTEFPAGTLDQVTAIGADPDVFGRVYLGYKGSGWIWGEPAPCAPGSVDRAHDKACTRVGQ